eukprot:m.127611 g.127611  ORF g.127611 m.127611 type:complete len:72 (+) comp14551_c0_seq10:1036-1251(+)
MYGEHLDVTGFLHSLKPSLIMIMFTDRLTSVVDTKKFALTALRLSKILTTKCTVLNVSNTSLFLNFESRSY